MQINNGQARAAKYLETVNRAIILAAAAPDVDRAALLAPFPSCPVPLIPPKIGPLFPLIRRKGLVRDQHFR
jgi:hypothetical protein